MHRLRYLEINWLSWAFKQREAVADRIRDIVAHESCEECRRLLFLLSRVDLGEL